MDVGEHVIDGDTMSVDGKGNSHSLGHLNQIGIVQYETGVGNAQIRHHENGCDVGAITIKGTEGDVVLVDGNLCKNGTVEIYRRG